MESVLCRTAQESIQIPQKYKLIRQSGTYDHVHLTVNGRIIRQGRQAILTQA